MEQEKMHFQVDPTSLPHKEQMDIFIEQTTEIERLHSLVRSLQDENRRLTEFTQNLFDQSLEYFQVAKIFQHFFWFSLNAPIRCIELTEARVSFRSGKYWASNEVLKELLSNNEFAIVKDNTQYIVFLNGVKKNFQYVFRIGGGIQRFVFELDKENTDESRFYEEPVDREMMLKAVSIMYSYLPSVQ